MINIEIKGEVLKGKTLQIVQGTTFEDILDDIGLLESSDISDFSLNEILYNNQIINIRKISNGEENSLISINNATIKELTSLPGIGEKLAQRIIDYRTSNGSFRSLDELMQVSGIGKSKYEKIKELITL